MKKYVEAVISQVVFSHAIVVLDEDGHLVEVEDIIEETDRVDTQVEEIVGPVETEGTVPDPREVEE